MTPAELTALRTAIFGDATANAFLGAGNAAGLRDYLNTASAFIAWRTNVKAAEIGDAWTGTDIGGMSSLNMQRLQMLLASSPDGVFDMTRADRRAGFENPFGTNASNASRVAMRAVWKRAATHAERLLATGAGTDASPGSLTFQGQIGSLDAARLIFKDDGTIWTP